MRFKRDDADPVIGAPAQPRQDRKALVAEWNAPLELVPLVHVQQRSLFDGRDKSDPLCMDGGSRHAGIAILGNLERGYRRQGIEVDTAKRVGRRPIPLARRAYVVQSIAVAEHRAGSGCSAS